MLTQFYLGEFQQVRHSCGFDPRAAETVRSIRDMGLNTILATNPLFPAVATHSRLRWAGLEPEEFLRITTYENSRFCKPNPDYYRQLLEEESLLPEECLMVGNDAREDMVAQSLGMEVFLLTDCLINTENRDLSTYPQGSFPELMAHIRKLTREDMVAQSLGMEVFLLTDCLINTENRDLSTYPQGSFPELMAHIRKLTA